MRKVVMLGVSMTRFGKHLDKSLRELSAEAVLNATKDAGIELKDIPIAYSGNSLAGLITGQEGVRGQHMLKEVGLGGIPIINVENACASATTALFGAWMSVASGYTDIALALGVEKMYCNNTPKVQMALASDTDVDLEGRAGFTFLAKYAFEAKDHMQKYGTTIEHFAKVAVKNHKNGALNPYAQYQKEVSLEDVLNSRPVAWPVLLMMAAPIGDGAAAAIVVSEEMARKYTTKPVFIGGIELSAARSPDARNPDLPDLAEIMSKKMYEKIGIGPEDLGVVEVHDAMSPAEMFRCEHLGLCAKGESGKLVDEGATEITGRIPVNTSGGLESKGHPIGATGLAQMTEIVWQLRGEAGKRQINPIPKVGLAQNGGGWVNGEVATQSITILTR